MFMYHESELKNTLIQMYNVVRNFKTTLKNIGFQYIKHLPKTQCFRRG